MTWGIRWAWRPAFHCSGRHLLIWLEQIDGPDCPLFTAVLWGTYLYDMRNLMGLIARFLLRCYEIPTYMTWGIWWAWLPTFNCSAWYLLIWLEEFDGPDCPLVTAVLVRWPRVDITMEAECAVVTTYFVEGIVFVVTFVGAHMFCRKDWSVLTISRVGWQS